MATWQWVLLVFVILLPLALMADFWPDRERLSSRGAPLARGWRRQISHPDGDDEEH